MTGIKRNLYQHIDFLIENFPVVAIIGSRQCGKTTLSQQLRPKWSCFDLENPRDFDRISHDPLLFFEQHPHSIIIDEAQSYPELFSVLRGVIDAKRELNARFILTGSSSPELIEKISESLAGRIAYVELSPLKTNEHFQTPLSTFYQLFENNLETFDFNTLTTSLTLQQVRQQWLYGGYPQPTLNQNQTYWENWMQQYRDTYLNRDMNILFPRLNKINYRRFLRMLASLSGTIINKAGLARNIEISQPTIHEYLHIAEGTFLWRNIPSYESNTSKSVIKMPKGILRDSGLTNFLLKINDQEILLSNPHVGLSFEAFVIEEVIRGMQAQGITNFDTYFYRTRGGAEIDLILHGNFGMLPIEIKYSTYTPIKKLKSLRDFVMTHQLKYGILINQGEKVTWLSPEIIQVPIQYL
jgi:predicted AAA+ superfamily ATPase